MPYAIRDHFLKACKCQKKNGSKKRRIMYRYIDNRDIIGFAINLQP